MNIMASDVGPRCNHGGDQTLNGPFAGVVQAKSLGERGAVLHEAFQVGATVAISRGGAV